MKQSKKDKVECPMVSLPPTDDSEDEAIATSHSEEKIDEMSLIVERERLERTYHYRFRTAKRVL